MKRGAVLRGTSRWDGLSEPKCRSEQYKQRRRSKLFGLSWFRLIGDLWVKHRRLGDDSTDDDDTAIHNPHLFADAGIFIIIIYYEVRQWTLKNKNKTIPLLVLLPEVRFQL